MGYAGRYMVYGDAGCIQWNGNSVVPDGIHVPGGGDGGIYVQLSDLTFVPSVDDKTVWDDSAVTTSIPPTDDFH